MSIVILYGTKTGTTQKCANLLAEELGSVDLINLADNMVDLSKYTTVIIGGSIRMGKINVDVKKFLKEKEEQLYNKKIGLFLCCGFGDKDNLAKQFSFNFSEKLLNHTKVFGYFGGELDEESFKGFDKIVAKMVTKANAEGNMKPGINREAIKNFAEEMKG